MLKERIIDNGTAITLTVGNDVIPATLNNCKASQYLISRLPYTTLHRYEYDYCGVIDKTFGYDKKDVQEINKIKEIETKIEIQRELLYKKIEKNLDSKEILKASEELDKLIVDYLVIHREKLKN